MTDFPADWALKAAMAAAAMLEDVDGLKHRLSRSHIGRSIIAHARLIEQTQPAPVDRKLLVAREAAARIHPSRRDGIERGEWDGDRPIKACLKFHELWESGYAA